MKNLKTIIIDFLVWSQKHTKADMLYLAKGGFWVMCGQIVTGILSLALLVAFANLIPKETYGTYRYILSIASILNIFTLTGMNAAVSRTVARGGDGILKPAVIYQLKWNLLMCTAFFILGGYYLINHDIMLAASYSVLGLFVPFTLALNTYGSFLEGKKAFMTANLLSVLSTIIYSIGILITLLISGEVIFLVVVYAITTFASSLVFYLYVAHMYKPLKIDNPTETLRYGRTLTYIRLLGPITSQIDKIIIAHFWGPALLATYSLAAAIPTKGVPALKKLVDIGFPKFAAKNRESINTVFYHRILQGLCIGTIITLLYIFIAPYLFKYLLPQYIEGIFYSQVLSLSFIFALPTRYIGLLFESQKMTKVTFINTTINSIIAILLYLGLGITGGIFGLVLAGVLHTFLGFMVNLISWRINSRPNPN